ncbi:MAG: amidohydrolase family protein [Verrucomicrobiota bacterium]
MMPIIDSHHHFWDFDPAEYGWIDDRMEVLKRDFGPDDLRKVMDKSGVAGAISVQARQSLEETHWLLNLAQENDFVRGVVGWVNLQDPQVGATLDILAGKPLLKGVRHVLQGETTDELILSERFNQGIEQLAPRNLVYDILIKGHQLSGAIHLVDRHPEQTFVLDHIAKPRVSAAAFDEDWAEHFRKLAERPNVFCKFSGVLTEVTDSEWSLEMVLPYWETALEAFGVDRLMFGSDWPVGLVRAAYEEWITMVRDLSSDLSAEETAAVFGGNALKAYGLAKS